MYSNYLIHLLLLLEFRVGGGLQVASVPQNHTQRDQQLPSKCARNLHMSLHRKRITAYLPSGQLHLCSSRPSFLPFFSSSAMLRCSTSSVSLSFLPFCPSLDRSSFSWGVRLRGEREREIWEKSVFAARDRDNVRGARAVGVTNGGGTLLLVRSFGGGGAGPFDRRLSAAPLDACACSSTARVAAKARMHDDM